MKAVGRIHVEDVEGDIDDIENPLMLKIRRPNG